MSEAKTRKFHNPEFKAKVGLEAVRGVKTINEIGQEYGVRRGLCHVSRVAHWADAASFAGQDSCSQSSQQARATPWERCSRQRRRTANGRRPHFLLTPACPPM